GSVHAARWRNRRRAAHAHEVRTAPRPATRGAVFFFTAAGGSPDGGWTRCGGRVTDGGEHGEVGPPPKGLTYPSSSATTAASSQRARIRRRRRSTVRRAQPTRAAISSTVW